MLESQIMILLKLQLFVPSLAALPRGTVAFAAAAAADDVQHPLCADVLLLLLLLVQL